MSRRILAISNHGNMLGGGEHSFLDLVSHLPKRFEPLALTPYDGELSSQLRSRHVASDILPLPPIRPRHIFNALRAIRRCLGICKRFRPGIIYANGSRACFYGGMTGLMLRIPVIWHCRISINDPLMDFLLKLLSDLIVTNSHATARRFSQSSRKVRVVYNGIDVERIRQTRGMPLPKVPADWKPLLCVARVSRWKRHDRILDAFEMIAGADTSLHLFFVGGRDVEEPEWWRFLQERTRRSSFADRIHWLGHIQDPAPWYRRADVFVLASEGEPFGRVLVEAMAHGLPVVAFDGGGVSEVIRNGVDGLIVSPDETPSLDQAIRGLLENPILRERLIIASKSRADEFSLTAHIKSMSAIFEEFYKR